MLMSDWIGPVFLWVGGFLCGGAAGAYVMYRRQR